MKRCYKCQKPYVEPSGPGFQEVCEGCSSYLHCCQNCYFYDPYQPNSCTEPMAEFVSDANGINRCEYFRFKTSGGRKLTEESEGRRFRKPDWRNLERGGGDRGGRRGGGGPRRRRAAVNPFASDAERAGASSGSSSSGSGSPFGGRGGGRGGGGRGGGSGGFGGGGSKAKKAREALDDLFKKE